MVHAEKIAIYILHRLTGNPQKHIRWEMDNAKLVDENIALEEYDPRFGTRRRFGTGYSLINFMSGYLNWHVKLEQGWVE